MQVSSNTGFYLGRNAQLLSSLVQWGKAPTRGGVVNEWQQFCDDDVGLESIQPASVDPKKKAAKKKFAKKKATLRRVAKKRG